MDAEPIRTSGKCTDEVYERFIEEYSKYIPENIDLLFSNLLNYLYENNINNGQYTIVIKNTLKELINVDIFDEVIEEKYIDFKDNAETNYRLSILLPMIVKFRMLTYKKAYDLASKIVLGNIPDYKSYEDLNLARIVLIENPITNFYVDLTSYLSEESLERFYNECTMLNLINNALEGKGITLEDIEKIDKNVYKLHSRTFEYLNNRFVQRNRFLERR